MRKAILGQQLFMQLAALLPFAVCAGGLYLTPDLTPRWELGLLTYAAVTLSYLAALQASAAAPRWRALGLTVPVGAWLAQLNDTQTGFAYLLALAIGLTILPLRGHGYRLFAVGAALALAAGIYKAHSYGF